MVYKNQHSCKLLSSSSASTALEITIGQDNFQWLLCYQTYATDDDVKSGEAEFIGEKLGEITIAIQYCPFCGSILKKDRDSNH
jgi:hypothetical protein